MHNKYTTQKSLQRYVIEQPWVAEDAGGMVGAELASETARWKAEGPETGAEEGSDMRMHVTSWKSSRRESKGPLRQSQVQDVRFLYIQYLL